MVRHCSGSSSGAFQHEKGIFIKCVMEKFKSVIEVSIPMQTEMLGYCPRGSMCEPFLHGSISAVLLEIPGWGNIELLGDDGSPDFIIP